MQHGLPTMSRRAVIAAGIGLILLFLGGAATAILLLYDEAIERGEENAANLVAVLAAQLNRSIQSVDIVVAETARDVSARLAAGAAISDRAIHDRLRERAGALAEVQGVALLDRNGILRNHSRRYPPPAEEPATAEVKIVSARAA